MRRRTSQGLFCEVQMDCQVGKSAWNRQNVTRSTSASVAIGTGSEAESRIASVCRADAVDHPRPTQKALRQPANGSRRTRDLSACQEEVERLMRKEKTPVTRQAALRGYYELEARATHRGKLLARNFTPAALSQAWTSDIVTDALTVA